MRALVCKEFGTAEKLVIEQRADPQPGSGQVVIDVQAAGLNFPDTLAIAGLYQTRSEPPFIPGMEAAGIVSAVGSGVKGVSVGDRVMNYGATGAFAEKRLAAAAETIPIPANMPFEIAAGFVVTYSTSYYALKQCAGLQSGETLLVLGAAGGVGWAAVDLGCAMGAKVIAAASSEAKLDIAATAGAEMRINYKTSSLKDEIKRLTGGKGADVVYDPVGGDLSEQALRGTGWNGRFLVVGFASGTIPKIPLNLPLLKNNVIHGVFWGAWAQRDRAAFDENLAELFALFGSGKLHPLVGEVYALDDYREAFSALTERRATGKLVFDMKR